MDVLAKHRISNQRILHRWFDEYTDGALQTFLWLWKRVCKMPRGGKKIHNQLFEQNLLEVAHLCKKANLQILSGILIMETVMKNPIWCAGGASKGFSKRAANGATSFT